MRQSRPMRARGLKLGVLTLTVVSVAVAPHAGAWIETPTAPLEETLTTASRPMRARGLKRAGSVARD